jgi:hypothetical protein
MVLFNVNSKDGFIILQLSILKIDFFNLTLLLFHFKNHFTIVFQPNGKNVLTTME